MSEKLSKKRILLLASNPLETGRLRLGEENRRIKEELLEKAGKREQFAIESCQATRYNDLNHKILKFKPNIVHFSGHGIGTESTEGEDPNKRKVIVVDGIDIDTGGLIVEDESGKSTLVPAKALADLFKLFDDTIECVVLNACFSHLQAKAIAEYIPYVVGMGTAIGDRAAIEFAVAFYSALGEGSTYKWAFDYACNAIDLAGIPESDTPKLFHQSEPKPEEKPKPNSEKTKPDHEKENYSESSIEKWIDRWNYLLKQEAIIAAPAQKFELQEQIKECRQKITELRELEKLRQSEEERNSNNPSQPNLPSKYKQIIDKLISGNIVPFLGPGINPDFYIDLVPSLVTYIPRYLNRNNFSEDNWISELIGIPCQNCPYLERPAECPMLRGIETDSSCSLYKQLLDKEQTLAVARMNLRYISQYFSLKDNLSDFYYELREIFKDIKSNSPNKIHKFFAELPGLMKLKRYPKRWKGLPYPMIMTTNYDNLLERAFDEVGQEYDVLYYLANDKGGGFKHKNQEEAIINTKYNNLPLRKPWKDKVDKPRPIILKLYGTVEDQFIMTQDQLNCLASGLRNKFPDILKNVISGTRGISILFLGCSPSDSELQLIADQIWFAQSGSERPRLPKASSMLHQSKPGELEREIWEQQWGVKLIELDSSLDDFAISLQREIEARIN